MPIVRGAGRRNEREDQGSCAKTFRASLRMTRTLLDRLARVKALQKPPTPTAQGFAEFAHTHKPGSKEERDEGRRGFSQNLPEGAERLVEILGAKLVQNHFGEHL